MKKIKSKVRKLKPNGYKTGYVYDYKEIPLKNGGYYWEYYIGRGDKV